MGYVSTIDNKTFSSKEEALKFFEEQYLFQQHDETVNTIINEIQNVVSHDLHVEVTIEEEQTFNISVGNNEYTVQAVLNCKEGVYCYGGVHNNLESVVGFFKWSTNTISQILQNVKNTYDFKEFKFDRYHDDYGNGHYFDFNYVTHEDTRHQITYEGECIEAFIKLFKQHFVNSVEGLYERIEDEGYFLDYGIDGVPIGGMLERAKKLNKKVRLEILN